MSRWLNLSKKHGLLSFNQCQQSLTLIARVQMAFPSSLKTWGETQVEGFSCHPHALCLPPIPLCHSKHERRGFLDVVFLPLRSSKDEWRGFLSLTCHLSVTNPLSPVFLSRGVFLSPGTCLWPAANPSPSLETQAEGFSHHPHGLFLPPTTLHCLTTERRGFSCWYLVYYLVL